MQNKKLSYSASLISQGAHRFYTLTMPSEVLGKTCFVSTRDDDPLVGFQRLLSESRAQEIADYIDSGLGTIPTSIILSAQDGIQFEYTARTKTVEFISRPKAFLILDGQHRVFGFAKASAVLRVPVVIYSGLSRRDETRLFIDINTKQRPVPNELLLDIKNLADYESDAESQLRSLFDALGNDTGGPLHGLLTPATKKKNKISRVTFNAALKPLLQVMGTLSPDEAHRAISNYLSATQHSLDAMGAAGVLTKSTVFRATMRFFPMAARKLKDRHGSDYSVDNFREVLGPVFSGAQPSRFSSPGNSLAALHDYMVKRLESGFSL